MKFPRTLYILFACIISNAYGQTTLSTVAELLKKIDERNRTIQTLSYKSEYTQVYSGKQDSLYSVTANIWLKKTLSDTIFNSVFHVKGMDNKEQYDYFYDSQNAYDVRHASKKVTVINPYNFPNDANNPAKARTALLPILSYLTNTDLVKILLADNPDQKLTTSGDGWLIELKYPKDKYGMFKTKWLKIDRKDTLAIGLKEHVLWNGIHINTTYTISNVLVNKPTIADSIPMQYSFNTYAIEYFEKHAERIPNNHLVGKPAPGFHCTSFAGNSISLNDFNGKYILLDFWETWCGNCILALPEINKFYYKYKKKLTVIGITTSNRKQVLQLIAKNNLKYANLTADKKMIDNYKIVPRPSYVLINPEGKIIEYSSDFSEIQIAVDNIKLLNLIH